MADTAKFAQPLPANAANFVDQAGTFLRNAGDHFLTAMIQMGEATTAARKAREFRALNELSDAELEKRGLTRDGLAVHVFGTLYS